VPLDELPIYVRDESLVVLGPERNHVGERAADPLTVEAFVTNDASFSLRGDSGAGSLSCARRGNTISFDGSATAATFILRVRQGMWATAVSAEGGALPRIAAAELERASAGWALDEQSVVVKARARRIEIR
jgi:hypothetical protein